MNGSELRRIVATLAELSDDELERLIATPYGIPQTAPGLRAWMDSSCDWELNRRRGCEHPLQSPEAAIPPEEDAVGINAAMVLRDQFARASPAILALFDALVGLLTGGGHKQ